MVWRTATALAALLLIATHGQLSLFSGENDEQGSGQSGMAMAAVQAMAASEPLPDSVDGMLDRIFARIEAEQLDYALVLTEQLIERYPKYRLGYLIKGDLLTAQMQSIGGFGASAAPPERIAELQAEALVRLKAYRERPPAGHVPRNLLRMTPDQTHAVMVDASRSRLYLFRNDNGQPRLVADYYVTQGELGIDKFREGDKRTPLGVYRVNRTVPKDQLIDLYGTAAFTLNYPNSWDRQRGRGGSGIWLHGTQSDTYARPPLSSRGCVVLTNPDIEAMSSHLQDGVTPVIISDRIEWISRDDWQREREQLASLLDAWRAEIGQDGIAVETASLSIFRNPGPDEVLVLNFEQPARHGAAATDKRVQYWMRAAGAWKVVHEGSA
jgi:hypothetical protein